MPDTISSKPHKLLLQLKHKILFWQKTLEVAALQSQKVPAPTLTDMALWANEIDKALSHADHAQGPER